MCWNNFAKKCNGNAGEGAFRGYYSAASQILKNTSILHIQVISCPGVPYLHTFAIHKFWLIGFIPMEICSFFVMVKCVGYFCCILCALVALFTCHYLFCSIFPYKRSSLQRQSHLRAKKEMQRKIAQSCNFLEMFIRVMCSYALCCPKFPIVIFTFIALQFHGSATHTHNHTNTQNI